MMAVVSAENSQARFWKYTRAKKMAKQKVLFMMAAPSRVLNEVVIDLQVRFLA